MTDLPEPLPSRDASEVLRATRDLAPVLESVLHILLPGSRLYRTEGSVVGLVVEPPPDPATFARLREMAFELVERPEWRARHAVAREVKDRSGSRIEALTPFAPATYSGGAALVGPFATREEAESWGGDHAVSTLSFDTFQVGDAFVVDLFDLPESDPHGIG